jgi:hypothetical protein
VQSIFIKSDKVIQSVYLDTANATLYNDGIFYVNRSKQPLKFKIQLLDNTVKYATIKPKKAYYYWANFISPFWLGFLVDKKTNRKYAYQDFVYLENVKDEIEVYQFQPIRKGTINLTFPCPYNNLFRVKYPKGYFDNAGFVGIGIGAEYYYKDNHYLSISACASGSSPVPIPVRYRGLNEITYTRFVSLRNNFIHGNFDFGYGVHYSELGWSISNPLDMDFIKLDQFNQALGFSFITQFRVSQLFKVGLLYQPSIINLYKPKIVDYQHFVSLEFILKIPIIRGKH